jgi:hypothetical protein
MTPDTIVLVHGTLYERYHIPASGNILWGGILANVQPGHQAT